MSNKWDRHFLQLCLDHARMSKDPSTKVGAVIVGPDKEPLSFGFNGFPRGIKDDDRLLDREIKYKIVVHGEENAILAAARNGVMIKGATLYSLGRTGDNILWGAPCNKCATSMIQAGISRFVGTRCSDVPDRWKNDIDFARSLLLEAGIIYDEVDFNG